MHAALRRLRLMRRRRETLLTTARGRELLADPDALMKLLHDDLGADGFDGDPWLLIEEVLHEHGPLESDRLTEIVGRLLAVEGWRDADVRGSRGGRCLVRCSQCYAGPRGMGSCAGTEGASS